MRRLAAARGGICLSDAYLSAHQKMEWLCDQGTRPVDQTIEYRQWKLVPQCAALARCLQEKAKRRYRPAGLTE